MDTIEKTIRKRLFEMQDITYKDFHKKLMPTVDEELIIGVRTPDLRKYANELSKTESASEFLKIIPHTYYEENNLHGFLIEKIKDYDIVVKEIDMFLPYIDNWATCDLISPKVFKKHLPELFEQIKIWITSDHTYTKRFAIGMLMSFYLDDSFNTEILEIVAEVKSEEYYVKMMVAWFFATALAKQQEESIVFIEKYRLEKWTHNKTIQKAVESNRISKELKEYLRTLKQK